MDATAETYQWPDWITPGSWISQDADGSWWAHEEKPGEMSNGFRSEGDIIWLGSPILDFTPPPCSDWRKSPMQKPEVVW